MQKFRQWFFYYVGHLVLKLAGWRCSNVMPPDLQKCVMIAAPHTSNWDLLFTLSTFGVFKIPLRFTIKREWMFPPMGWFFAFLGAIGIDRRPKEESGRKISFTQAMIRLFDQHEHLTVLVTPEGTRAYSQEWKTGFYHVAKAAGVPVALGFLDYKEKHAGVGAVVYPSDDMAADMRQIMAFYQTIHGKYPEKFSIDTRYRPE
ncbi:MAG: 1-acyl-sn-glycerol-3-phosphate acyltransferase [Bernardetiaceae bacterium]